MADRNGGNEARYTDNYESNEGKRKAKDAYGSGQEHHGPYTHSRHETTPHPDYNDDVNATLKSGGVKGIEFDDSGNQNAGPGFTSKGK